MVETKPSRRGFSRQDKMPRRSDDDLGDGDLGHAAPVPKTRVDAWRPEGRPATERVTATARQPDPLLVQFLHAASANLLALSLGGGPKSKAVSARVNPDLLAAAGARLGMTNQSDVLNAGLALLAGADTYGAWLIGQAGTIPADFEVDV